MEQNCQKNFTYLNKLIHSGEKEIKLEHDIIYEKGEKSMCIFVDVNDIVIDGNGHSIDARGLTRIFIIKGRNVTIKNIKLQNGYAHLDDYFGKKEEQYLTLEH